MQKYINNVAVKNGARVLTPLVGGVVTVTGIDGSPAEIFDANGGLPRTSELLTDINGAFSFYAADGRYTITITGAGIVPITISDVLLEDPVDGAFVIVDGAIVEAKIGAGAVTTPKIIDGAVTAPKLADNAVTAVKLAADAVTNTKVAAGAAIDSAKLAFLQAGAGAVLRTLQNRLQESVAVTDFGADPTGVADSYAAIKAAVATGKVVVFPQGTYSIAPGQASIDVTNRTLVGAGIYRSTIQISGANTQTTVFHNNKAEAAGWGTGGNLEIRGLSMRGNWDGSTALADQSWDNTAALLKIGSGAGVRLIDVSFGYAYGHNAAFYQLGYATFTRIKSFTARKHGLHLEAPSGASAITSTWIQNCDFNSNRGLGNVYIKNGVGVWVTGCVFEDSLCGVHLDGNDNRNVTIENNHAESHENGLLQFVGAGTNTVYAKNFVDSAVTRSNPPFQKLYAHSNENGFNGIESGFGPLLMDVETGNGAATNYKFGFYGSPNFDDVVGRVSWRTNNNNNASNPVAEIRSKARGNVNQGFGSLEFGTGKNGLVYHHRIDEDGQFYPITTGVYSLGLPGAKWANFHAVNVTLSPPASVTPVNNGEMSFQLTSNTSLTIKVKGSDGVVRSASLTLA